ncbi:unnamed protein product [Merluccius merluccius]
METGNPSGWVAKHLPRKALKPDPLIPTSLFWACGAVLRLNPVLRENAFHNGPRYTPRVVYLFGYFSVRAFMEVGVSVRMGL